MEQQNYIESKIKEELIQNGGTLTHDFSNNIHYEYILNSLGGKELLKSKFPIVYSTLEETRNIALKTKDINSNNLSAEEKDNMFDCQKIDFIHFPQTSPHNNLKGSTPFSIEFGLTGNFIYKQLYVSAIGTLKNDDNEIFDFSESIDDTSVFNYNPLVNLEDYEVSSNDNFLVHSKFCWATEINGKPLVSFTTTEYKQNYNEAINIDKMIKNITIEDPMNTKSGRPETYVVYNRYATGFDYKYSNVVDPTSTFSKIMMPFKGSLESTDSYRIVGIDKNEDFSLTLTFNKQGLGSFYNGTLPSNFYDFFTLNNDQTKLSWQFPEDWNCKFFLDRFKGNHYPVIDFECSMYIRMYHISTPENIQTIKVRISSRKDQYPTKKIPRILLYWGCIGKDTNIKMPDGKKRKISELKIGDTVLSSTGRNLTIKDIITGKENLMIYIETHNGKNVIVTDTHPIFTEKGLKRVMDLTAADSIKTENGFEKVKYLYPIEYNDIAYNLRFDDCNGLICNGLILGDFETQNSEIPDLSEPKQYSKESLLFRSEFKELLNSLKERKLKNV
ncbi:hypothetical protein UT300005_03930 [Clostridium sp. CTA-5]